MADKTVVKIKVPKMVVIKNDSARELRKAIEEMAAGLTKVGKLSQEQADATVAALFDQVPASERDYPIDEFVGVILDTAPAFTGGRTKAQRIAFRIQEAFEGRKEGDVITLDATAHDLLKAFFEKPEYTQPDAKTGERKTVEGVVFTAQVWRKCCPYADAICEPMKDEEPAKPAESPAA